MIRLAHGCRIVKARICRIMGTQRAPALTAIAVPFRDLVQLSMQGAENRRLECSSGSSCATARWRCVCPVNSLSSPTPLARSQSGRSFLRHVGFRYGAAQHSVNRVFQCQVATLVEQRGHGFWFELVMQDRAHGCFTGFVHPVSPGTRGFEKPGSRSEQPP